jgi:dTDP-4-dehydrorhamnose reductase
MTKYHGEKIVEGGAMIVRISYPFGGNVSHKKDLVATLRDLLERKIPIKGVIDQEITPTWIDDIAHSLDYLMHHFSIDTFHIIGSESLNAFDLIQKIGDASNLDTSFVGKTTFKEFYSGKASRPQHARMKSKKNSFHTMHSLTEVLEMK